MKVSAASVCAEAARLVAGDREKTHGPKMENFRNIAEMMTGYLRARRLLKEGVSLTALDASLLMCQMKIARTMAGGYNPDDFVDLAGYAGCAGEIADQLRDV